MATQVHLESKNVQHKFFPFPINIQKVWKTKYTIYLYIIHSTVGIFYLVSCSSQCHMVWVFLFHCTKWKGLHQRSTLSSFLFTLVLDEFTQHIQCQVRWMKQKCIKCYLWYKNIIKLLEIFYSTVLNSAILYETKCLVMMNTQENKLNLVKMRILLWIIGLTRKNRISNNFKRKKKCRVMPIVEKIVNLVLDSLV